MDYIDSQKDMRRAYLCGATGVLVSGIVWLIAATVALIQSNTASMLTLFFGGMLIFPVSVQLARLLGAKAPHAKHNVLRHLAIENLGILFGGLFIAFVAAQQNPALFYPVMLIIIGARYLTFQSVYGLKTYWILGVLLMLAGFTSAATSQDFVVGAFVGGGIEIGFALLLFAVNRKAATEPH